MVVLNDGCNFELFLLVDVGSVTVLLEIANSRILRSGRFEFQPAEQSPDVVKVDRACGAPGTGTQHGVELSRPAVRVSDFEPQDSRSE